MLLIFQKLLQTRIPGYCVRYIKGRPRSLCLVNSQSFFVTGNRRLEQALIEKYISDMPDSMREPQRIIECAQNGHCFFIVAPSSVGLMQVVLNLSQSCDGLRQKRFVPGFLSSSYGFDENLFSIMRLAQGVSRTIASRNQLFRRIGHGGY